MEFHLLRAAVLLSVGQADRARVDIDQALRLQPRSGHAHALQAIIALVNNDKDQALTLAQQAVNEEPNSAPARMALSYVQQSRFKLDSALASAQETAKLAPQDALVHARLSELWLARGERQRALDAAQQALKLDPGTARTHTVLGFAHLARMAATEAQTSFEKAIALDAADPLPRLGLGLAQIRRGELAQGRESIEIAVSLDPNQALIRSYLGKAYYEEKRGPLDQDQFEMAKALDPQDPTPFFYDALRKHTENRPVEALRDLERAIELNDNRAVYRSRLLLDEDLAARGAALGRIYDELGFEQRGLVEGWKSTLTDPSDYTAHRLLSDTYSALPNHEVARVSELLQSQLLQPLNITPVQPQLAESDLFLLGGLGPATPSLNEFNPLFLRDRFSLLTSGLVGSHGTYADEVVQSGQWDRLSYSLGQFHYETEGFRENNDLETNIYNAFAQLAVTPELNAQIELRHQDSESGDFRELFEPGFSPLKDLRDERERDTVRVGFNYAFSPNATLLGTFGYRDMDRRWNYPTVDKFSDILIAFGFPDESSILSPILPTGFQSDTFSDVDIQRHGFELQQIFQWEKTNLTIGTSYNYEEKKIAGGVITTLTTPLPTDLGAQLNKLIEDSDRAKTIEDLVNGITEIILFNGTNTIEELSDKSEGNAYVYLRTDPFRDLNLTLGAALHHLDRNSSEGKKLELSGLFLLPKVGAVWTPLSGTTLRAAWFRNIKQSLATGQTIEPTHIAGFSQLFNDPELTHFERYGFGLDQELPFGIKAGGEMSWRELKIPRFSRVIGGQGEKFWIEQDERQHRAYFYWTPLDQFTFATEYFYASFDRQPLIELSGDRPINLTTHRVPLSLRYYSPTGLFASFTASHVDQEGLIRSFDLDREPNKEKTSEFWLLDASLGYRLPNRWGLIRFGVKNLLDEQFSFQDSGLDLFDEIEGDNLPPAFVPERFIYGQITLAF